MRCRCSCSCICRVIGQPAGKNHVTPKIFRNIESNTRIPLQNNSSDLKNWGEGSMSSKVAKCKFSKSIFFRSYSQKKPFWPSWEVKIRPRSPKVIKYKFSKSVFLSSYAQKRYFRHHGQISIISSLVQFYI